MIRVSREWFNKCLEELDGKRRIDITVNLNIAARALVTALDRRGILYKVYNLGAGVKRITTDTDTCPCCKRKL